MTDEYIRRQDAINAATQDSTENRTHSFRAGQARSASRIKTLPSADVVQVVRCHDCRKCSYDPLFDHWWCNSTLRTWRVKPDDFCSYGERKKSE